MLMRGWARLVLGAAVVVLATAAIACSDDDDENGAATGSTGAVPTASGEATSTPEGQGGPSVVPGGGTTATATPGGGAAPPSAPTFEAPPVTTASANGETVETGIGTYCWTMMCVDKIGVPTKGSLTVSRGDTVTIAVPANTPPLREAAGNVFEATQPQKLDDGSEIWPYPGLPGEPIEVQIAGDVVEVVVDLAPGRYVLGLSMYFSPGDVVYGVLLEVE